LPESNPRHLDPDIIAAFCAHALGDREQSRVFAHLSECARCRDWVALTAGVDNSSRAASPSTSHAGAFLSIAAGVACAILTAWLLTSRPSHPQPANEIVVEDDVQADTVVAESAGIARTTRVRVRPHAERTVQLPAALTPMQWDADAFHDGLPPAWRRIRLASADWHAPQPNQFSLRTTVGEKWITFGELWESGTGVQ